MNKYPKRKENRLKFFDYSSPKAYFITICTKDHKSILSSIHDENTENLYQESVGAATRRPFEPNLTNIGRIVDEGIKNIPSIYEMITVDYYVIMPNHVHLLLQIHETDDECGRRVCIV